MNPERLICITAVCLIINAVGCAPTRPPVIEEVYPVTRVEEIDTETRQRVEHILGRIRTASREKTLENLGRSTMSESVALMDMGDRIAPILIQELKSGSNWKFRFWLVDMLGFVGGYGNILPLVEVIEDNSEREKVRLRACESIKELRLPEAVRYLLVSREIVSNPRVKAEIQKAIDFLR